MAYDAGTAFLQIVPSFNNVEGAVKAEVEKIGRQVDNTLTKSIPEGVRNGAQAASKEAEKAGAQIGADMSDAAGKTLKKELAKEAKEAGEQSALEFAGAFAKNLRARTGPAMSAIPKVDVKVDADLSEFDRKMMQVRASLSRLDKFYIEGKISDDTLLTHMDRNRAKLQGLQAQAPDISSFTNARAAEAEVGQWQAMVENARLAGFQAAGAFGGAFDRDVRQHVDRVLHDLPQVHITPDSTELDHKLADIRHQFEGLRRVRVGVDMDAGAYERELRKLMANMGSVVGSRDVAHNLSKANSSLTTLLEEMFPRQAIQNVAEQIAGRFGGAVEEEIHRGINDVLKNLPEVSVGPGLSAADQKLSGIREKLGGMAGFRLGRDVDVADYRRYIQGVKGELDDLAAHADADLKSTAEKAAQRLGGLFEQVFPQGPTPGRSGGMFDRMVQESLGGANTALPNVTLGSSPSTVDRQIAEIKAALESLSGDYHIQIRTGGFETALAKIKAELEALRDSTTDIDIKLNAEKSIAHISGLLDAIKPKVEQAGDEAGDKFGGRFAEKVGQHFDKALTALPKINIEPNTTDAQLALKALRDQLDGLSKETIGVTIDETFALAQIDDIKRRLDELARSDPSVRVRTEAAAASAELAGILELAKEVDHSDPTVKVKVDKKEADDAAVKLSDLADKAGVSGSRIGFLIALGVSLGTTLVPAAAAAAVAVSGIATAAAAAGAGLGVFALSMSGVIGAVQALNQYENDQAKSAASLSNTQERVAGAVDSVASAERSLANTRENVAEAAARAAQTIVDAQRGVTDAQRQTVQSVKDLQKAYDDARKAEEDRALALRSNELAQRQAVLDLADAKKALDLLMANPRATDAEREHARIVYAERALHIDELSVKQKRLKEEQAQADKTGIEGSTQVVAAKEKVRAANENVGKAEERLANAIDAQQKQQRQGAFQLVQATQAVENAQRQLAKATTTAGVAGGAALANLQWAMQQLGPAGESFARFIFGLKGQFLDLRDTAQSALLPGLRHAIEGLMAYMPQIKTFTGQVAGALGGIFIDIVHQLENPSWQRFFRFIGDTAVPSLQGMARFTMLIAQGLADLIVALSPFNGQMGAGLTNMAEGFAHWAATLSQSAGYYKFLDYVARTGPMVVELFSSLGKLIARIVVAAAPVGETVLGDFIALVNVINSMPLGVLTTLLNTVAKFQGVMLLVAGGLKVWGVLTDVLKYAIEAKNRVLASSMTVIDNYRLKTGTLAADTDTVAKGMFSISAAATEHKAKLDAAGAATEGMSKSMAAATSIGVGLRTGLGALISALGGPFGIALTVAGAALAYFSYQSSESSSRLDGMKSSLIGLAEAYNKGGDAVSQYLANQIRSDDNFRKMIENSDQMGLSLGTITQAVHGNKSALDTVNRSYSDQISLLTSANDLLHNTQDANVEALAGYKEAAALQEDVYKRFGVSLADRIKQVKEEKKAADEAAKGYRELQVALGIAVNGTDGLIGATDNLVAIMKTGNAKTDDYKKALSALSSNTIEAGTKLGFLTVISDKLADSHLSASDKAGLFRNILQEIGSTADTQSPTFSGLTGVFNNIATSALSAADKTSLLKQALDQMYGAARSQSEATDRMIQQQDELKLRLQDNTLGFDTSTASTTANEQAIIGNRNSLRDALKTTEDKYIADIAAAQGQDNMAAAVQTAKEAHDRQVQTLLAEIPETQRTSQAVRDLVKNYGTVPGQVDTTIKTSNVAEVYKQLELLEIAQFGLANGLPPEEAQRKWELSHAKADQAFRTASGRWAMATGGPVNGPGGPTDDLIPAWLSNGEYIIPAKVVASLGIDFFDQVIGRSGQRQPMVRQPGDGSEGIAFARGGPVFVGPPMKNGPVSGPLSQVWPFLVGLPSVKMPTMQEIQERWKYGIDWQGTASDRVKGVQSWITQQAGKPYIWASAGPQGYDCSGLISAVWNLLHNLEPYSHTFSTMNEAPYFPQSGFGLFTAGWANAGEAGGGDVGHTAGNLAGLAFESRGGDGVVVGPGATKVTSFAHLGHYDRGGKLPVGLGAYLNTTSTPENVLTDGQWSAVFDLAQRGSGPPASGHTYNIEFADTTLTPSKLRAMQAEDAVRAREGRAR